MTGPIISALSTLVFLVGDLILSRSTEVIFDSSLSYISVLQSFIRWYQLYLQIFLECAPFLFHCISTSTNQVEAFIISSYTISVASCFLLLQSCSNSVISPSHNRSDVLTMYTLAHHSSPQDIYKLSIDCEMKFKFLSTYMLSCLVMFISLWPPWTVTCQAIPWTVAPRLLCPWNFPGKNSGVSCHFPLQSIFLTQRLNPSLLCLLHK